MLVVFLAQGKTYKSPTSHLGFKGPTKKNAVQFPWWLQWSINKHALPNADGCWNRIWLIQGRQNAIFDK